MKLMKWLKQVKWLSLKESAFLFVATVLLIGGWEFFEWNEEQKSQREQQVVRARFKASIDLMDKLVPKRRQNSRDNHEVMLAIYEEFKERTRGRHAVTALKPREEDLVPVPELEPLPLPKKTGDE